MAARRRKKSKAALRRSAERKPSASRSKAAAASFIVSVNGSDGAPRQPKRQDLQSLFIRAWSLVPVSRRPDIPVALLKKLSVDVMVVSDEEIARLNKTHLRHEGPTDVLSFPMGELDPERRVFNLGEIVVSFATAKREAAARRLPYEQELSRYCVHGFLHLLGYEDETRTQREEMFAIQERALGS